MQRRALGLTTPLADSYSRLCCLWKLCSPCIEEFSRTLNDHVDLLSGKQSEALITMHSETDRPVVVCYARFVKVYSFLRPFASLCRLIPLSLRSLRILVFDEDSIGVERQEDELARAFV